MVENVIKYQKKSECRTHAVTCEVGTGGFLLEFNSVEVSGVWYYIIIYYVVNKRVKDVLLCALHLATKIQTFYNGKNLSFVLMDGWGKFYITCACVSLVVCHCVDVYYVLCQMRGTSGLESKLLEKLILLKVWYCILNIWDSGAIVR